MRRHLRLLPVVIFAAALTLTLKVGGIWHGLAVGISASRPAAAEEAPAKPPAKSGAPAAEAPPSAKPSAKPVETGFDPARATDAELEVLEKLAARRSALDQRSRDLDLRESLLQATEARIDSKIAELKEIKKTIDALLQRHDEEQEAKLRSLVKIYESMKPKDAAQIFEKLEMNVMLDVIERMREARAAPILARMSPAKAKSVTSELAARRALPAVAGRKRKSAAN